MSTTTATDARELDWAEPAARTRYTQVPDWLIDRTGMSVYAKQLYTTIGRYINNERGCAFPGMALLASKVGCSERRLRDAKNELVEAGILHEKRRPNMTSLYRLRFTDPALEHAPEPAGDPPPDEDLEPSGPAPGDHSGPAPRADPDRHHVPPNQTEEEPGEREDAHAAGRICERVASHVLELDPDAKPDPDAPDWRAAATAILADDGRQLDQVLGVLDRLDGFWAGRILNPRDLRHHLPRIVAVQAGEARSAPPPAPPGGGKAARRTERAARRRAEAGACCAEPGAGPSPADAAWKRLAAEGRAVISRWEVWFTDAHPHTGPDGELLVAVPESRRATIETRFGRALEQLAGHPVPIVSCEDLNP